MSEYFSVLKYAEFQIWQNAISVLVIAFDSSWDKKCGWQKNKLGEKPDRLKDLGHDQIVSFSVYLFKNYLMHKAPDQNERFILQF